MVGRSGGRVARGASVGRLRAVRGVRRLLDCVIWLRQGVASCSVTSSQRNPHAYEYRGLGLAQLVESGCYSREVA